MNHPVLIPILLAGLAAITLPARAQQQPPPPTPYSPTLEERLEVDKYQSVLEALLGGLEPDPDPDAAVFLHVARMASRLRLYTNRGQVAAVIRGLQTGIQRCGSLARAESPWKTAPGRTLRGYVSRIDGSIQPYGLVLPPGFDPERKEPYRLDIVLHGRGPTEVTFLTQNEPSAAGPSASRRPAEPPPAEPLIELHPFGRGNNGWRWAGETDVFEALEQVRRRYRIDPDRIYLRGFSMGGHGAWHLGLHYPDRWAAVSPGAGFTDTRRYLKIAGEVPPYQERGWQIYDAVDYALNAFNTPFVAYGGEKDPQLQAALNMREAMEKEGLPLDVIVGPDTAHAYHPESLREIMRRLAPRKRDPRPREVRFTTRTLKYNRCFWVTLDGLEGHYRRADVRAEVRDGEVRVTTSGVTALSLEPVAGPGAALAIDGERLRFPKRGPARLAREGGAWRIGGRGEGVRKRHRLQGPIDDAFTDRFLAVRGTGTAWTPAVHRYAEETLKRFQEEWRLGFRGEVPLKPDTEVTEKDWRGANLILFGDPGSNRILARIAGRLPVRWTRDGVQANGRRYGTDTVPVLVYPNPLNPQRYVVINSGHTWTARDLLASNAYLTPKLPDWAILKLSGERPEVLDAGFFDEGWRLGPADASETRGEAR